MKQSHSDSARPRTFAFVSLGCPKNLVDSERMLGKLAHENIVPVFQAGGDFNFVDGSALTVSGTIEAGELGSHVGNIFLESQNASGITFTNTITLESGPGSTVSLQADALTFSQPITIIGATVEYAPYTSGTAMTLGGSPFAGDVSFVDVSTLRIGAVTDPGATALTTTAGSITIATWPDPASDDACAMSHTPRRVRRRIR